MAHTEFLHCVVNIFVCTVHVKVMCKTINLLACECCTVEKIIVAQIVKF